MSFHVRFCVPSRFRFVRARTLAAVIVVLTGLVLTRVAHSHHSFAMYDTEKLFVLHGKVKEFQWTNPHALLWVVGSTDGGADDLWTIELPTSPGNLSRMGWTKHSLAPGDELSIELNPLRDGSHGGSFKQATIVDTGQVLVQPSLRALEKPGLQ